MTNEELMTKFELSPRGLQSLYGKLQDQGLLNGKTACKNRSRPCSTIRIGSDHGMAHIISVQNYTIGVLATDDDPTTAQKKGAKSKIKREK